MAVSAAVFISLPKVKAADSITIVIDGRFFQPPDAPPFISNDRVMVPFRPIAEAMGASANWDGAQKKVSVALGNKYVEFVIGSATMNLVTVDANGGTVRTNVILDAPATLVNDNRAFVPIRALTEGLGASVQWMAESRTVMITSNVVRATPAPVATPTPFINPVFATTANFEIISGKRAQDMYDYPNHEVVFYFNSSDQNAVNSMPAVMQAAAGVKAKVWGVDTATSGSISSLNWVYSFISRNSQGPALFFLYNINQTTKVIAQTAFNDQNLLYTLFDNWNRNNFTNALTPTATPAPTGSVTPTPTFTRDFTSPFAKITKPDAIDYYENNDTFILLFFNNQRSDFNQSKLDAYMQAIYLADEDYGYQYSMPVYYINDADSLDDYSWFGADLYADYRSNYYTDTDYSKYIPNPCLFFVSKQTVMNEDRSLGVGYLADQILNFFNNNMS